jgi:hypothetical protein
VFEAIVIPAVKLESKNYRLLVQNSGEKVKLPLVLSRPLRNIFQPNPRQGKAKISQFLLEKSLRKTN